MASPTTQDDSSSDQRSNDSTSKPQLPDEAQKICRVCGDRALGHNFNVVSCESCKAFFRRNALKTKELRCAFDDKCTVNVVSRRFCQKCRLRKCFEVGMKKEWIWSEETIEEKRHRKNRADASSGDSRPSKRRHHSTSNTSNGDDFPATGKEASAASPGETLTILVNAAVATAANGSGSRPQSAFSAFSGSSPSMLPSVAPLAATIPPPPAASSNTNVQQILMKLLGSPISPHDPQLIDLTSSARPKPQPPPPLVFDVIQQAAMQLPQFLSMPSITKAPPPQNNSTVNVPRDVLVAVLTHLMSPQASSEQPPVAYPQTFQPQPEYQPKMYEFDAAPSTSVCVCGRRAAVSVGTNTDPLETNEWADPPAFDAHGGGSEFGDDAFWQTLMNAAINSEFDGPDAFAGLDMTPASVESVAPQKFPGLTAFQQEKLEELISANEVMNEPLERDGKKDPSCLMDVINLTDIAIRRIIKMSKKIGGFSKLCQEDQIALLKGGCIELMILRGVMTYDPEKESWHGPQSHCIKLEILKEVKGRGLYEEHKKYLQSFKNAWRQDEPIMLFLGAITLFTPTRANVLHSEMIRSEQEMYSDLLRRYLEISGADAQTTYTQVVKKVDELHQLNDNAVRVFLEVNPKDVEPLLIEIFDLKSGS